MRAASRFYGYGTYFAQYQKPMAGPSRGFSRAYTHTTTAFVPSQDEAQGSEPALPPIRKEPGPEVLDEVKDRVNHTIAGMLTKKTPLTQAEAWFLSKAYYVKWTPAYRNAAIVEKVTQALDVLYCAYRQDPEIVHGEKSIYNSSWFGLGPAAQSVVLLSEPMAAFLDHEIEGAPGIARRAGWSQMFLASRDWHRENRRQYTNQTMISDTYGLYLCNRAVAALDPKRALPEEQVLHYLYQSAGIEPWVGSEKKGQPLKPLGDHYYQLTSMGLTKELGFVGYYGEVTFELVQNQPHEPSGGRRASDPFQQHGRRESSGQRRPDYKL